MRRPHPACRRPSGLRRRLALTWLLALAWALAWVLVAPQACADEGAGRVVSQAMFVIEGGAPHEVALPHTWARAGLPNGGKGRYRIDFDLARVPETTWSLGGDRVSSRCAVTVNGSLVHDTLPLRDTGHRAAPVPTYVDLPAALLRDGRNTIEIEVELDARAGLSPLRVGPSDWVRTAYLRAGTFGFTVPQALNVGAAMHDYLFLRGLTSVMDRYWMPFTSPLALLVCAWAMVLRFVGALGAMETQAGDLERKVAERTHELELANAA